MLEIQYVHTIWTILQQLIFHSAAPDEFRIQYNELYPPENCALIASQLH